MTLDQISVVVPKEEKLIKHFDYGTVFLQKFSKITGIMSVRRSKIPAHELAIAAIEHLNFDPKEIRNLIHITNSPAMNLPATAHLFHKRFKLSPQCKVIEVNQSCSGYIYGLYLAHKENGLSLVVTSDTLSRYCPSGNNNELIFSDGASATLSHSSILRPKFEFLTDSSIMESLISRNNYLRMFGDEILSHVIATIPDFLGNLDGIDEVLLHQANLSILETIEKRIGRIIPKNISKWGNTSSTSIPLLMADKKIEAKKAVLCGYGAGFSAAKMTIEHLNPSYALNEI